jgi:tRNA threonylcarbamoyladenosine biosynthesis protein TsaB
MHHAYNLATKRDVSNDIFLNNPAGVECARVRRGARGDLLTLSVDTATEKRSAAVVRGGRVLSLRVSDLREGVAAAGVLEDVDRALAEACVRLEEIELFAAAGGPGSFTGLRSGLATLKALSVTLGKPLVGVPTLHAIAHAARPAGRLVALIPAGRGEVFAQLLCVTREGSVTELCEPMHVRPARIVERAERLGGGVKWAGGGAFKFLELIREAAEASGLKFSTAADTTALPSGDEWVLAPARDALAADVAALGQLNFKSLGASGADEVRALYVRPSDAEMKG